MSLQVVGKDVPAAVGMRVVMAEGQMEDKGVGSITAVHANGGYCSVRWDSGLDDRCLFTGQQGDFYLALADDTATTAVVIGAQGKEAVDSSAQLHKQLLAQEVAPNQFHSEHLGSCVSGWLGVFVWPVWRMSTLPLPLLDTQCARTHPRHRW